MKEFLDQLRRTVGFRFGAALVFAIVGQALLSRLMQPSPLAPAQSEVATESREAQQVFVSIVKSQQRFHAETGRYASSLDELAKEAGFSLSAPEGSQVVATSKESTILAAVRSPQGTCYQFSISFNTSGQESPPHIPCAS